MTLEERIEQAMRQGELIRLNLDPGRGPNLFYGYATGLRTDSMTLTTTEEGAVTIPLSRINHLEFVLRK